MANPDEMLAQDRRFLIDQGQILQHRAEDTTNNAAARMQQAQAYADELFEQLMKDGGYTEDEIKNIVQEELIKSGMATPEELASNFLTDEEGRAIQGQPQDVWNYFERDSFNKNLDKGEQGTRAAIDEMAAGYDEAIDPEALAYQKQQYGDTAASLEELKQQALMTPEQQQDIVTAAGISAGTGYRAAKSDLERKARAAGIDPLGTAAMGQEMERNAAADAGDAMTRARIGASDAAAGRAFNYFGAEMGDLARKDELNIGQERYRLGAQQGLTDTQMRATRDVGTMRADAAQADMNSRLKTGQYLQDTAMKAAQDVDDRQRETAWKMATNRQDTGRANQNTRFAQSSNAAAQLGDAYSAVADARKQGEWAGLNYQANKASQANADWNAAQDRQFNVYTGAGQMRGANTGQTMNWQMRPRTWEKVGGMVIGGAAAAAQAMSGVPTGGGKADGDIITKPTLAIVGENGPEEIRPLRSKLPDLNGGYFDNPMNDPEQPGPDKGIGFGGVASIADGAMQGWNTAQDKPFEAGGYKYGSIPMNQPRAGGGYADGGIVTQPTVAMVGENGPEEIRPVNRYGYRKPANEAPKMAGGMYAGASEPYQPTSPEEQNMIDFGKAEMFQKSRDDFRKTADPEGMMQDRQMSMVRGMQPSGAAEQIKPLDWNAMTKTPQPDPQSSQPAPSQGGVSYAPAEWKSVQSLQSNQQQPAPSQGGGGQWGRAPQQQPQMHSAYNINTGQTTMRPATTPSWQTAQPRSWSQPAPQQEGNPPSLQTKPQYGYGGRNRQRRVGPAPGGPPPPDRQPAMGPGGNRVSPGMPRRDQSYI